MLTGRETGRNEKGERVLSVMVDGVPVGMLVLTGSETDADRVTRALNRGVFEEPEVFHAENR